MNNGQNDTCICSFHVSRENKNERYPEMNERSIVRLCISLFSNDQTIVHPCDDDHEGKRGFLLPGLQFAFLI